MKKVALAAVIASLIAAVLVYAQPTTTISFGPTVTVLSTTSAGAVTGSTYALPGGNANVLTWQLSAAGSPSAISASLQASNDGTNWQTLSTCTTTTGCIYNAGVNAYVFVRTIQTSRTGGTSTTASINTDRAYGVARGSNPTLAGNLLFSPTNTYSIGMSRTANAPSNIYAGTGIEAGSYFGIAGLGLITAPADGNLLLRNNAGTNFGLLQLGGTTSSFPAWKRNGAQLLARLADDSANADVIGNSLQSGTGGVMVGGGTLAGLGTPADGTLKYCSDCLVNSAPCTGSSTGAIAKRIAGAWRCD